MSKVRSAGHKRTPCLLGGRYHSTILTSEVCAVHTTTPPCSFDLPATVPFAFSLTALAVHLTPRVDQRKRRGKRYPLVPLLLTAVLAKLAGYARREDLSDWARLRAADLTTLFGLSRSSMPHQAIWSRVFAHAVDLDACEARLTRCCHAQRACAEVPERGSSGLALDGTTLRGCRRPHMNGMARQTVPTSQAMSPAMEAPMNVAGRGAVAATSAGALAASHGNRRVAYRLRNTPKNVHVSAIRTTPTRPRRPVGVATRAYSAGRPRSTSMAPRTPSALSGTQRPCLAKVDGSTPAVSRDRNTTWTTYATAPIRCRSPSPRR